MTHRHSLIITPLLQSSIISALSHFVCLYPFARKTEQQRTNENENDTHHTPHTPHTTHHEWRTSNDKRQTTNKQRRRAKLRTASSDEIEKTWRVPPAALPMRRGLTVVTALMAVPFLNGQQLAC